MDGLLDFKYRHKLSRQREQYILSFLEKEQLTEILRTKGLMDAVLLLSVKPTQEIIDSVVKTCKDYIQMALPSDPKADKIEDIGRIDRKALKDIKARLTRRKEAHTVK